MKTPVLRRVYTELKQGDFLRSSYNGTKLVKVHSIEGNSVVLVTAGKVKGGVHTPPQKPVLTKGRVVEGSRVWTGVGDAPPGRDPSIYVKVEPSIEITGLHL